MPRRNLVLLLVEGDTDSRMLVPAISNMLNTMTVAGQPFRCDVTTARIHRSSYREKTGMYPKDNVVETITAFVDKYLEYSPDYGWAQLSHIVHLTDLDGCFTPDEVTNYNPSTDSPLYFLDHIETNDVEGLLVNHREKRAAISRLVGNRALSHREKKTQTRKIPYRLFYVSRNFEHAFLDNAGNLSEETKGHLSRIAALKYAQNPQQFRQLLETLNKLCGSPENWQDSWRYAMHDNTLHSLERGSNLYWLEDFINSQQVFFE